MLSQIVPYQFALSSVLIDIAYLSHFSLLGFQSSLFHGLSLSLYILFSAIDDGHILTFEGGTTLIGKTQKVNECDTFWGGGGEDR